MTRVIDRALVKAGFEAEELERDRTRIFLYMGILGMASVAAGMFITLTASLLA